ncbi:DNase I-like protein [Aulographum hederae CBS 113979]|uniref:DNase I-like protein n=1 Tax=Aulographum hederae CBS 113979 TaxID=1176131 RepID=A0A6G1H6F3_9PEZI|nr:DNase I-like protein [Aulographum hederae CBS 113979]
MPPPPPLELYLLTFNCARNLVSPQLLAPHLLHALATASTSLPSILAISLQEVAPIAYSFLGGSYLLPYYARVVEAVQQAAKSRGGELETYSVVAIRNVGLTALMVFARQEVAERVSVLQEAEVGVGVWEMGNKGAMGIRLGYTGDDGVVEMTFVAAHLAPMESAVLRRNQDWENIVRGLVFAGGESEKTKTLHSSNNDARDDEQEGLLADSSPSQGQSSLYTPTSHVFFFGDLNYRTHTTPPNPTDYKTFPQPSITSASSPLHLSTHLSTDQLQHERLAGRTLHGFSEEAIDFPPTYKYSEKESDDSTTWAWARHRWPSWCDRILYIPTPGLKVHTYTTLPLEACKTSDHRAVALSISLDPRPVEVEESDIRRNPPFGLKGDWEAKRAAARRREVVVGLASWAVLTNEGRAGLVGSVVGALVLWWVVCTLR